MNLKLFFILPLLLTLVSTALFGLTRKMDHSELLLVLNMDDLPLLPRNFRMTTDEWELTGQSPSKLGFEKLKASGSGQFSKSSLETLLLQIPAFSVVIVDLREESHGFLNGNALSWYGNMNLGNLGKLVEEIAFDEQLRLQQALNQCIVYYTRNDYPFPFMLEVQHVCDEAALANRLGVGYLRIPCTDHRRPTDSVVDDFIYILRTRHPDAWLHFHCSAGKGRTTTFMTMLDIFINAKEVGFEDILLRQKLIGGKDMWNLPGTDSWKYESMIDRIDFLKNFYRFCQSAPKNQLWTEWLLDKN